MKISSYASIFALGHKMTHELLETEVHVQEKVDGCVAPEVRVLKADLTWEASGSLKVGDRLIGLVYKQNRLRLAESYVTVAVPIIKECVKVITDRNEIIVSADHP